MLLTRTDKFLVSTTQSHKNGGMRSIAIERRARIMCNNEHDEVFIALLL